MSWIIWAALLFASLTINLLLLAALGNMDKELSRARRPVDLERERTIRNGYYPSRN